MHPHYVGSLITLYLTDDRRITGVLSSVEAAAVSLVPCASLEESMRATTTSFLRKSIAAWCLA